MKIRKLATMLATGCVMLATMVIVPGCEPKKESIIDIETPRGGVEVQRDKETGNVNVEVEGKEAP